jgi:hypothetical protein
MMTIVSLLHAAQALGRAGQRVRPVQDRCELAGLDETGEGKQVLPLLFVRDQPEPLPDQAVDHDRPQDASDGPEHVAGCAAVENEGPRRGQCPAQPADTDPRRPVQASRLR